MQAYTAFRDDVEVKIQDSSNANFTTAELDTFISQACREAGREVPHVVKVSFTIESRFGFASSTSANNLVDASKSQFLAGDVGKIVHNITDKTWAVIKTYTSTSIVVLSKDIMASGEQYEIYNAGCTQKNQVSLSNVDDYLDIEKVEYPIGNDCRWDIDGTVLTIKARYIPDSRVLSAGTQPETEVMVWFKKRHLISQLTDLLGAVNNAPGYVAGDTSMAINGLQASGTIEQGQEFTVADVRGTYTVTADATITTNAATVSFFPGLESAVANTIVVTFLGSTLTPTLEPIVKELAAALAVVSKPMSLYQHSFSAVTAVALTTTAIALVGARITQASTDVASARTAIGLGTTAITSIAARITQAATDIASGRTDLTSAATAITDADTELDKMVTAVDLAKTALASGLTLANTVPVGGGLSDYALQAQGDIGEGQARMTNGQSYLQKASAFVNKGNSYLTASGLELRSGSEKGQEANINFTNANTCLNEAATELRTGDEKLKEGDASLRKANVELQIVASGRTMESWGRAELVEVRAKLRRLVPRKYLTSVGFGRD